MKDLEEDDGDVVAAPPGRLTPEQQALVAERTPWRQRMAARLARRFGNSVGAERIDDITLDVLLHCAARFDEKMGVPFGAYTLKAMVYAVSQVFKRGRRRAALAYRAAASNAELSMGDPKAILGTDEEREAVAQAFANRAAAAIVLAGGFSRDAAGGDEDGLIGAIDHQRALARLPARGREVLERRYGPNEETLVSIAAAMKIGLITARRAHDAALGELHAALQ